jgi:hypothetical protein
MWKEYWKISCGEAYGSQHLAFIGEFSRRIFERSYFPPRICWKSNFNLMASSIPY